MQCAAAAERHGDEPRGIMPALDRDEADRAGHLGIRHAHDRLRCGLGIKAERFADMGRDGVARRLDVEARQLAADRPLRIDAAEDDVGVGQGRPRRCPRRSRPDPGVSRRSPARPADSPPVSTWAIEPPPAPMVVISIIGVRMTRPKSMVALRSERRLATGDQRHVERGAAEIAVITLSKPAAA